MIVTLEVTTGHQGLHCISRQISKIVSQNDWQQGLCSIFIPHTSASLLIQENYDASAQQDLEAWLNRLVPENDALYTHTLEGPDDMPAHIKSTLTATSVSVPIDKNQLLLGPWQGIYVWEHRHKVATRQLVVHLVQ